MRFSLLLSYAIAVPLQLAGPLGAQAPRAATAGGPALSAAEPLTVSSPDGALTVTVGTGAQLTWSVALRGRVIVQPSRIGLTLAASQPGGAPTTLGANSVVANTTSRAVDQVLKPVVRVKRAEVRDHFNERRIDFVGGY